MKDSITNRQMFFIILMTLTVVTIVNLPRTMAEEAGVGSWFTLILTSAIYAVPAFLFIALNRKFQGEVLFDYSKRLVGKFGSYVLGGYYLVYFILISGFLCASMANILVGNFFLDSPPLGVILLSLPFYGYTAYKGIRATARVCEFLGVLYLIVSVAAYVFMLLQGDLDHIQPFIVPEDTISYLRAIPRAVSAFLGFEVLSVMPIAQKDRKKAPRVMFFTLLFIGFYFALGVESCIMITGINEMQNDNNALISAIRQLEVPVLSFFERIDVFYLTVGFAGMFLAKTIVILTAVEYACKILPKMKRIVIVIAVLIAVFVLDIVLYSVKEFGEFYKVFFLSAGNLAAIGIPVILFIIAKVKKNAFQTN